MLPKKQRLTTKEFKEVFEKGARYSSPNLLFVYLRNKDRAAISCAISKKNCPNAVDRNKTRRFIYECINSIPAKTHIAILVKKKIDKNTESAISAEIGSFMSTL